MLELASERAGGRVMMVTSFDPAHPGESAIDGRDESYWMSTGLYPQELMLELGQSAAVLKLWVSCTHVRRLRVEGCQEDQPVNFILLAEEELDDTHGRLQLRELGCCEVLQPIRFVRVLVMSGWFDFCSFHRIQVMGKAVAPRAMPGQQAMSTCSEDVEESISPIGGGSPSGNSRYSKGSMNWGDRGFEEEPVSRLSTQHSSNANSRDADFGEEEQELYVDDRHYWLEQVTRDGWRLADAPAAIRSDREVVLAAIAQDGLALEYAASHLRADQEIVLAALNQDPWAGQYMAEVLQFSANDS